MAELAMFCEVRAGKGFIGVSPGRDLKLASVRNGGGPFGLAAAVEVGGTFSSGGIIGLQDVSVNPGVDFTAVLDGSMSWPFFARFSPLVTTPDEDILLMF